MHFQSQFLPSAIFLDLVLKGSRSIFEYDWSLFPSENLWDGSSEHPASIAKYPIVEFLGEICIHKANFWTTALFCHRESIIALDVPQIHESANTSSLPQVTSGKDLQKLYILCQSILHPIYYCRKWHTDAYPWKCASNNDVPRPAKPYLPLEKRPSGVQELRDNVVPEKQY